MAGTARTSGDDEVELRRLRMNGNASDASEEDEEDASEEDATETASTASHDLTTVCTDAADLANLREPLSAAAAAPPTRMTAMLGSAQRTAQSAHPLSPLHQPLAGTAPRRPSVRDLMMAASDANGPARRPVPPVPVPASQIDAAAFRLPQPDGPPVHPPAPADPLPPPPPQQQPPADACGWTHKGATSTYRCAEPWTGEVRTVTFASGEVTLELARPFAASTHVLQRESIGAVQCSFDARWSQRRVLAYMLGYGYQVVAFAVEAVLLLLACLLFVLALGYHNHELILAGASIVVLDFGLALVMFVVAVLDACRTGPLSKSTTFWVFVMRAGHAALATAALALAACALAYADPLSGLWGNVWAFATNAACSHAGAAAVPAGSWLFCMNSAFQGVFTALGVLSLVVFISAVVCASVIACLLRPTAAGQHSPSSTSPVSPVALKPVSVLEASSTLPVSVVFERTHGAAPAVRVDLLPPSDQAPAAFVRDVLAAFAEPGETRL